MNRTIFKNLAFWSLLTGLIFGMMANIPFVGGVALFLIFLLAAPIVILFLIMAGKNDLLSIKDSIIQGATVGFFANLTFSFAYAVINALMFTFFQYTANHVLTTMIINSPVWLLITVVLFIGVLTSTTNAFTGFVMYYIISFIRDIYEKNHSDRL